jgi:LuxR family quorum-sensing transcriptional regulator LasR
MFNYQPIDMDMLESLFTMQTEEEWSAKVFQLAENLGFDQSLFAVLKNKLEPLENAYIKSNYSTKWRDTYDQQGLGYVDPTVAHCLKSITPFLWTPDSFTHNDAQKNMYEEASKYGLEFGVVFPIYGSHGEFGMYAFSSQLQSTKHCKKELFQSIAQLSLLKEFVLETSKKFIPQVHKQDHIHLTPREKEIIEWTLIGKSCWEISMILSCSEATINFHMNNIRKKFKVRTKQQIMVKAVTLGMAHV